MSASLQVELRSVTPAVKQSGIMKKKIYNIRRLQSSSRGTYGISNYNYDEIIKLNISGSARFLGCSSSLLPLGTASQTNYISVEFRACSFYH